MGVFDSLAETTKFMGREAERLLKEKAPAPVRAPAPTPTGTPTPVAPLAPSPAKMEKFRAVEQARQPLAGTPMERFKTAEQASILPDFDPVDPMALDPAIYKTDGTKMLNELDLGLGSSAGLDDSDFAALGGLVVLKANLEALAKYAYTNDPDYYNALSTVKMAGLEDAGKMRAEDAIAGKDVEGAKGVAAARAQDYTENNPLLNPWAALKQGIAEVKAQHPYDFALYIATPEGNADVSKHAYEAFAIPPEKAPPNAIEKAAGWLLQGVGWAEEKLLDLRIPILLPGGGTVAGPQGTPQGVTLREIRTGAQGVTRAAFGDSFIGRALETAETIGTSPTALLLTLALPPGGAMAKAALLGTTALGAGVGGEAAVALDQPRWAGELIGGAIGGVSALKVLSYASPSALLGEAKAVKPFTGSLTDFAENLGKRRWASVSATTSGMTEARALEANTELAAKLQGLGFDAQVVNGAWLDNGLPTLEKSVFIPDMTATDAAALGAELRQESVTIPEGILNVRTNELNPVRGAPAIGSDLPIADGYTELTISGRQIRFSLPIDWDNPVPFQSANPLEPAAGAGRLTVSQPNEMARQQIGDFTVWSRQRLNGEVEIGFSAAEGAEGTGFRESRDEIAGALRKAVEDNPGKQIVIQAYDPKKEGPLVKLLKDNGMNVDDNGVVTLGDTELPRITFQPGPAEDLTAGVSWKWLSRRVYQRVYQVTGKVPLLRRAVTPLNPQALLTEPMTKEMAALNGWLDWAHSCNQINLARMYSAARSGWMSRLLGTGSAEVELTSAGRASQAYWNEAGQTLATWNDILTYGATYYKMSSVDARFVGLVQKTLSEYGEDLAQYGIEIRELLYADGQGWIPRGSQAGKNGVDALQREYSGGRRVGSKGSFLRERLYETQAEFVKNGGQINRDAFNVIATTMTAMRRMEFDAQFTAVAERFGVQISKIVSPELKEAPLVARAYRTWDKRIADYITAQMKDLTVRRSFRQLRPISGQVPDTWYPETVEQVQSIVDKFQAEVKGLGQKTTTQTALNRIARPYKAELKELLGATKLRQKNSMALYLRAKTELEADVQKIRSSLIAGPTERVKPEYFGRFPEDSFAIGTMDSSRWPKLSGRLFPEDIVQRLDRVMNDQGNTVSAAIQKLNDVPRTLQTGADMNFPFIQGMPLLFRNPVAFGKSIARAYGSVFDDPMLGTRYMLAEAERHPEEFQAFLKWVRQMGEQEFFQSARTGGFVYKTPLLGRGYARLANGFDTMLDLGRWEYWKSVYAKAKTDGDLESLGAVTRDLLGTTSTRGLGVSLTQRQIEGGILLFAPRYTRSAFGLLGWAMNPGVAGAEARRSIFSLITGGSLLYYAACKVLGQEPQFNPMESGFMSIRVGDNYLGMGGIFRSMLRSAVWSMDAAINDPSKFYDPSRTLDNPVFEFFRSRSAPVTTKLIDVVSGRDFVGKPTRSDWEDIAGLVRRSVTPFGIDTILDSKGAMLPRIGAIVGEFFLGRSTPVSVNQLRDEAVYRWSQENNVIVHDFQTGQERPPKTYRELTDDQRILFDKAESHYTQDVQDSTAANKRAWAEMDQVSKDTERQLISLETVYNDPNSPHYQDGTWYRSMRANVLQNAAAAREQFFTQNPAVSSAPTTQEQKWVADYNETVIKASRDEALGEIDWLLEEQLDREWRRKNGTEAAEVVDREYAASSNRLDNQFRMDRLLLQPFFDFEDSMWSQDFFSDPDNPIALPSLSNGQKALNFRSDGEYRSALRADIFRVIQKAGKIPDNLAGIPTTEGGDTLGERFPGKLSDTQVRRASNVLVTFFMRDFYDKRDGIVTEYLKEHPKYMTPLLTWDYWTGSVATEEFLP